VVGIETLRAIIPDVQPRSTAVAALRGPMASPGLLPQHYAPRTPMILYPSGETSSTSPSPFVSGVHQALAAGKRIGVLATKEDVAALGHLPVVVAVLGSENDVEAVAARLYAALRELDAANLDVILAHDFPERAGLWQAVRDRLHRASTRDGDSTLPV
jgi:L-threonylcarbamoyladenylate synthase